MDAKHINDMVKDWYTRVARSEWKRLWQDPYHQIEFMMTMHFLEKHLPEKGLLLDSGGGPGRYTIALASKGYDVILLDITPRMLEIAKRRIRQAGVQGKVKKIVQGSIADLSMFDDKTFDGVLCLGGPLSHVLEEGARANAVKELIRVARIGAPIFVSVIGRIGVLKGILLFYPQEMQYGNVYWETGNYIPGVNGSGFTSAHWFLPEELKALFERQGVEVLEMAGLEGLSSHHRQAVNKLSKDKEKWSMWLDILLKTCTHVAVVGGSEHFLLIGKRV